MGIYQKYLLPKIVHHVCGQRPAMRQRQKVVPLARGRVLEIGIGSGLNIPFYNENRVDHLWGLDPSAEMWSIAERHALEHHIDTDFIQSGAESIPLDDNCADTVMMTYTLCSIEEPMAALAEIHRVLKPGGQLVFCEHGQAPDIKIRRWQDRVNPIWRQFSGGCHLNRPIRPMLEQSGFNPRHIKTMYLPGWKPATFNIWGTATI